MGEGDRDIHDKSSGREGISKEKGKESATRRSTFTIDEEKLASLEVDEDDIEVRRRRRAPVR